MALLSILFNGNKVVLNDASQATGFKGAIAKIKRNIQSTIGTYGGIVLDCCESEDHVYKADVTENPIEDGSSVSDHVSLKPVTLKIDGLVSDSPIGFAIIGTALNVFNSIKQLFGTQSRSKSAMDSLIKLWKDRTPFTVVTNLKRYDNMVISELEFPYTSDTGHGIDIRCEMVQVSIVKSKILNSTPTVAAAPLVKSVADLGSQSTEAITAGSSVQNSTVLSQIMN